jgi:hypothetical protein
MSAPQCEHFTTSPGQASPVISTTLLQDAQVSVMASPTPNKATPMPTDLGATDLMTRTYDEG